MTKKKKERKQKTKKPPKNQNEKSVTSKNELKHFSKETAKWLYTSA